MNTPAPPCIDVRGVRRAFGPKVVLDRIDFRVPRSQICGLLGPSGAGKTTLVRMIAGIDVPDSGSVNVLGETMPKLELMRQIGYMAQSDALYAELSAKHNLEFFGSLYGLNGRQLKERMRAVMEIVNLRDDLNKKVAHYSGGMKRRLSLAIALLHEPDILILDEPTVGIDPVLRQSIWTELGRIRDAGTTILVTTHVMDEADKCDTLGMIRDGNVIAYGTPDALKRETGAATIEQAFLTYGGAHA